MASSKLEETLKTPSEEFVYLPPPREDLVWREEGLKEKFARKTKENPFVPLGKLAD